MAVLRGGSTPSSPRIRPTRALRGCQHLAAAAEQVCLQTAGASRVPREQSDLLAEVLLTYTLAIRGIVMVREPSR